MNRSATTFEVAQDLKSYSHGERAGGCRGCSRLPHSSLGINSQQPKELLWAAFFISNLHGVIYAGEPRQPPSDSYIRVSISAGSLNYFSTRAFTVPQGFAPSLSANEPTGKSIYTQRWGKFIPADRKILDPNGPRPSAYVTAFNAPISATYHSGFGLAARSAVRLSTFPRVHPRTRDQPLDAHHGLYQTFTFGVTPTALGSSSNFSRFLDRQPSMCHCAHADLCKQLSHLSYNRRSRAATCL